MLPVFLLGLSRIPHAGRNSLQKFLANGFNRFSGVEKSASDFMGAVISAQLTCPRIDVPSCPISHDPSS